MDLEFVRTQPQRLGFTVPEDVLGKGNLQPFTASNSGVRTQMFTTHNAQKIVIAHPEVPIISTGYENKYGERSSTFIQAEHDCRILAKIPKFSRCPNHIYYVIYQDLVTGEIELYERSPYYYITEVYGFMKNNDPIDTTPVGGIIKDGTVVSKSTQYDEFNNRMDGVNLLTVYLATDKTKEDSIIISESAAKKMGTYAFHKRDIVINDNDDPINLYGQNGVYKVIPDILEHTKDSLICALRRRKKEDSLYTQASDRMCTVMFNDDKFYGGGILLDLNIYCNNPDKLGSTAYDAQLKYYYEERKRVNNDIIALFEGLRSQNPNLKFGRKFEEFYYTAVKEVNGSIFKNNDNSAFSNIRLEVVVCEEKPMAVGDKMSNRYGGKGVISEVRPDSQMMVTEDGRIVDIIQNKNTVMARENPGQLDELEINNISRAIVETIRANIFDVETNLALYKKFVSMVSESFGVCVRDELANYDLNNFDSEQEMENFLSTVVEDDYIFVPVAPISDNMNIDKLAKLYEEFPMAKARPIYSPITDSTGQIRFVPSRRVIVAAPIYYYRLKQIGEEKFSATSLSPINHRGENSKSKASKYGKYIIANTPVRLGDMELTEFTHLGAEPTIVALLIYANSPQARRRCAAMITDDPYNPNITLDMDSTNRNAEIFATYLKTEGLRYSVTKVPKFYIQPFGLGDNNGCMVEERIAPFVPADQRLNPFIIADPNITLKPNPRVENIRKQVYGY